MADSPKQSGVPPIWETLEQIGASVPKEEWDKAMPRPAEWAEHEVTKLRAEVQQLFEANGDLANIIGKLDAELRQLKNERKNCPPVSESEYVKRLEDDNFALAANQCHDGYAGEYGHHMCGEVEELKKEVEYWKGFVPASILRDFPFKEAQNEKTQTEQDR
jgi:hypothetical protein